jgi:hypothetical protein
MRLLGSVIACLLLAGALAGCASEKYDQAYFYYSDAPGNGHSRTYTYPTDYTRDYRSYPGDSVVANH